jgi:hypothetical protein
MSGLNITVYLTSLLILIGLSPSEFYLSQQWFFHLYKLLGRQVSDLERGPESFFHKSIGHH